MTGQEVMDLMQRYLDQDLTDEEYARLMEYLKTDPEKKMLFDRMKRLSDDLANLPKVTPPHSIVDSILPRLEEMEAEGRDESESDRDEKGSLWERIKGSYTVRAWGGIAVAAAILGLIVFGDGLPKMMPNADEQLSNRESSLAGADVYSGAEPESGERANENEAAEESSAASSAEPTGMEISAIIDTAEPAEGEPESSDTGKAGNAGDTESFDAGGDVAMDQAESFVVQDQYGEEPQARSGATSESRAPADADGTGDRASPASPPKEPSDVQKNTAVSKPSEEDDSGDAGASGSAGSPEPEIARAPDGGMAFVQGSVEKTEPAYTAVSPDESLTAYIYESEGQFQVVIRDDAEREIYTAQKEADRIEHYTWSENGQYFEYILVSGEDKTSVTVDVETGTENRE